MTQFRQKEYKHQLSYFKGWIRYRVRNDIPIKKKKKIQSMWLSTKSDTDYKYKCNILLLSLSFFHARILCLNMSWLNLKFSIRFNFFLNIWISKGILIMYWLYMILNTHPSHIKLHNLLLWTLTTDYMDQSLFVDHSLCVIMNVSVSELIN